MAQKGPESAGRLGRLLWNLRGRLWFGQVWPDKVEVLEVRLELGLVGDFSGLDPGEGCGRTGRLDRLDLKPEGPVGC